MALRAIGDRRACSGGELNALQRCEIDPSLARLAEKYGADLTDVTGTGEGGRVEVKDVILAIKAKRTADLEADRGVHAATAQRPARSVRRGAAYALNPLVDKVRASASRSLSSPAPTLFAAGDLPSFTVSGIPPESLLDVPWQARHAMASAHSPAQAYAIAEQCSGPDAEQTASMLYGNTDGNEEYAERVHAWRLTSMSDQELDDSIESGAREELARREASRPLNLRRSEPPPSPAARRREPAVPDDIPDGPRNVVAGNGREPGQWSDPRRWR